MADADHGIPNAVVRTTNELYVKNGRRSLGINVTVPPEVLEQYRQGYRCLACHHFPQPQAFPERCCEPYCRFPIKRDQIELLEYEYQGETDAWPDRTDEDRRADLNDQGVWLPGS